MTIIQVLALYSSKTPKPHLYRKLLFNFYIQIKHIITLIQIYNIKLEENNYKNMTEK